VSWQLITLCVECDMWNLAASADCVYCETRLVGDGQRVWLGSQPEEALGVDA